MTVKIKTLAEINDEALKLLYKHLGPVDAIRFLNQYTHGFGDYAKKREHYLEGVTLEHIFKGIEQDRSA